MIKLKLDSSKVLNAQNTFASAWLPGFTRHRSPDVSATGRKADQRKEEVSLSRQCHRGFNKASQRELRERGREVERIEIKTKMKMCVHVPVLFV